MGEKVENGGQIFKEHLINTQLSINVKKKKKEIQHKLNKYESEETVFKKIVNLSGGDIAQR